MVIGLIVGGTLTAWLGWRSVFFINVPIGAALTLLAPGRLLPPVRHPGRLDLAGALTSTAGVVLLVYGFIRAAADGWANPVTAGALALAVILLAAFAVIETRVAQPLVPPHLLARRDRVGSYLMRLLLTGAMTSELFFLTLYFQDVMRLRPLVAALAFVPTAVPVIFVSRLAGRLMSRVGAKPVLVAGALITTAGVAWLSQLSADSGYVAGVLGPIILTAVGCGFMYPAMALVALTDVPRGEAGAASGMLQAAQQIGGSLGLAALGSVFAAAAAGGGRLALATGIAAGFTGGTVIMAVVTLIAVLVIRRQPHPAPTAAAAQPAGPVQPAEPA
jgi:MFS family permease